MSRYEQVQDELRAKPRRWLVTGVAGFIGSSLLESLLELDQPVTGLDNFATGRRRNLDEVRARVGPGPLRALPPRRGRRRLARTPAATPSPTWTLVLHQAALGSVPRSIEAAARVERGERHRPAGAAGGGAAQAGIRRFVYASSSSVYGDSQTLPKLEPDLGRPLSPYAVTKLANELYASVYGALHGMETVGLRYFNVFGPRQDPEGAYAAVIPKWVAAMIRGERGADPRHGRDQPRLLPRGERRPGEPARGDGRVRSEALNQAYNVAAGRRTTLVELFELLRDRLVARHPRLAGLEPEHGPFRTGDVLHSLADIGKARRLLGYEPTHGDRARPRRVARLVREEPGLAAREREARFTRRSDGGRGCGAAPPPKTQPELEVDARVAALWKPCAPRARRAAAARSRSPSRGRARRRPPS